MSLIYTTISSGQKVSADVDIRAHPKLQFVNFPTMTSGDTYMQGSTDATSANFVRLQDNVGQIAQATGPGSTTVMWPGGYQTPSRLRVESLVSQTDIRTLTFSVR